MNTFFKRIGFLSFFTFILIGLSSCSEEEIAQATVTVLQEQTVGQGQVNQVVPVEGAEVRFFVPKDGAEHLETIDFTDSNGKADFSYQYEIRAFAEVTYLGFTYPREFLIMKVGDTYTTDIILPE